MARRVFLSVLGDKLLFATVPNTLSCNVLLPEITQLGYVLHFTDFYFFDLFINFVFWSQTTPQRSLFWNGKGFQSRVARPKMETRIGSLTFSLLSVTNKDSHLVFYCKILVCSEFHLHLFLVNTLTIDKRLKLHKFKT